MKTKIVKDKILKVVKGETRFGAAGPRNSREVRELLKESGETKMVTPYKGGWAVCQKGEAKEVFVGPDAEQQARARLKEL